MAFYIKQQFGQTIAPGATLRFWYSWQGIPPSGGFGPNHGPVLFTADPVSHQNGEVKLITFDVAKCRNAPPNTEVFYEYSVRSQSAIAARFDLEVVWGRNAPPAPQSSPW